MVPSVDPPAPVLVEGELEYIVEKILDSRVSRRKLQYLVKWKGYAQEDNSWVFASDVHAPDLVRAFHMAHPGRPGSSGEGSVTPPQGGGTVVNSVAELPPVVTSGTSAGSLCELPLVEESRTAASEFPSSACQFVFFLLAGSSGTQRVYLRAVSSFCIINFCEALDASPRSRSQSLSRLLWKQASVASELWDRLTARSLDQHRHLDRTLEQLRDLRVSVKDATDALSQAESVQTTWEPIGDLFIDSLPEHIQATKLFKEEIAPIKDTNKMANDLAHQLALCDVHLSMENARELEQINSRWKQLQDIVPVYQIKGISKLVKLCLPKVQCFCDSLTSPPSERQFNALLMSVASLLANTSVTERLRQLQDAHRDFGPESQHFLSCEFLWFYIKNLKC
ncbi:unnamed protein product [Ranitomeya imitator]|uniref:Chromo domain-containing protein n=1 Tax=Ranitomeya imitator TaxID=111125 RepID=A0ABN9LP89_9NEOB|nr:unnamed protein product [Ranitomeya imitator]